MGIGLVLYTSVTSSNLKIPLRELEVYKRIWEGGRATNFGR